MSQKHSLFPPTYAKCKKCHSKEEQLSMMDQEVTSLNEKVAYQQASIDKLKVQLRQQIPLMTQPCSETKEKHRSKNEELVQ
jgi:hypothetical protein